MQKLLTLALLLAAVGLVGCTSDYPYRWSNEGVLLSEQVAADGSKVVWKLYPGQRGEPKIIRTETRTLEQAAFDIVVTDIDADLAKNLNVNPWRGVWVQVVGADSPAQRAGMRDGDIIRAINGADVLTQGHLNEVIERELAPGLPAEVRVQRWITENDQPKLDELVLTVTPRVRRVIDSTSEPFPLQTNPVVQELTGVQLVVVPPDLAREIYQVPGAVTVVSGVVIGSPAYMSGLRGGDRIVEVDGGGGSSSDVAAAVAARTTGMNLPPDSRERLIAESDGAAESVAARSDPVELGVTGPLGRHTADVAVVSNLNRSRSFNFPILFDYHGQVNRTKWSFLDFILQFGANYRGQYVRSTNRDPAKETLLSLFPFGMFEFETTPTRNEYTFLWFISWETRK